MNLEEKYSKILNYYYRTYNQCPVCYQKIENSKPDKIDIKCSDCGFIINLNLAEYINLYQELFKSNEDKAKILAEISRLIDLIDNTTERKTRFNELKSKYLEINKKTNKLKELLAIQKEKLDELNSKKFNVFNDLLELYFQRKNIYQKITEPLTHKNRTILMEVYKNEGVIKDTRVKQLVKETGITETNIKLWIQWFDTVLKYSKKNKELQLLIDKIKLTEKEFQKNNENYLIKPFQIKDFKEGMPIKKTNKPIKIFIKKSHKTPTSPKKTTSPTTKPPLEITTKPITIESSTKSTTKPPVEITIKPTIKPTTPTIKPSIKPSIKPNIDSTISIKKVPIYDLPLSIPSKKDKKVKKIKIHRGGESHIDYYKYNLINNDSMNRDSMNNRMNRDSFNNIMNTDSMKNREYGYSMNNNLVGNRENSGESGNNIFNLNKNNSLGDLTGKTITIDPNTNVLTWSSLEGLNHIDVEKI
jgi:hypothetical protein